MKKIYLLLTVSLFFLSACSSDEVGPPGPQGPPGESIDIVGQTFEFEGINFDYFSENNIYSTLVPIPEEVEVLPSDAILVYLLEVIDGTETWSLIPQNYFLDEGIIQYVYNHNDADVELIIDGDFDLSTLDPGYTQDQVFRFVVLPSDFMNFSGVDVTDYKAVMSAMELEESKIPVFRE